MKRLAKRILGEYPEKYEEMLTFIDRFSDLQETPAQFQERCGQIALACFWKEQQEERNGNGPVLPSPDEDPSGLPMWDGRWLLDQARQQVRA